MLLGTGIQTGAYDVVILVIVKPILLVFYLSFDAPLLSCDLAWSLFAHQVLVFCPSCPELRCIDMPPFPSCLDMSLPCSTEDLWINRWLSICENISNVRTNSLQTKVSRILLDANLWVPPAVSQLSSEEGF